MAQLLEPISTASNTWTLAGDASAHLCVDEGIAATDGDTTRLQCTSAGGIAKLGLGTTGLVPSDLTQHKVTVNARTGGVLTAASVLIELMQGTTVISSSTVDVLGGGGATYTNYVLSSTSLEAASITDYTNLFVRVTGTASGSGNLRISTIEFSMSGALAVAGQAAGSGRGSGSLMCLIAGQSSGTGAPSGQMTATAAIGGFSQGVGAPSGSVAGIGSVAGQAGGVGLGRGRAQCAVGGQVSSGVSGFGVLQCLVAGESRASAAAFGAIKGAASISGFAIGTGYGRGLLIDASSPGNAVGYYERLGNTIRAKFNSGITLSYMLPTQFDNQAFDPPATGSWCRFAVIFGNSDQVEMGEKPRFRTVGQAVAMLFVPIDLGDRAALALADRVSDAFRATTDQDVIYRTPSIKAVGRAGNRYQLNVSCPFYSDRIP